LSFEIQELLDIIRVIILINIAKGKPLPKSVLKRRIDRICTKYVCIETSDFDKTLTEMAAEGLILVHDESVQLTDQGVKLGKEWRKLLLKKEPIIEVVAGLTDGSITGLVVVLSSYIANLSLGTATFAALLTLAAVAITNFSSFLLGGITEDLADMLTLQTLIRYSVSDIPNGAERNKSLMLVKQLFTVLHKEISRANLYAAIICGTTTYLAGGMPIIVYLLLPHPIDIILALSVVGFIIGAFLVRYRSQRTKVHWKITLFETVAIVAIAVIASLIVGSI
jgi:VIT1/CCC1 family predicted Fe2+/Mn2+ transporter